MSVTDRRRHTHLSTGITFVALLAAVAGLAGCGSSSPTVTAQAARATPGLRDPDGNDPGQRAQVLRPHHESAAARRQARASRPLAPAQLHPKAALGPAPVSDTRRAGSTKHTKAQRIAHPQFNPCTLVSLAEAHTITGGSVLSTSEAPLGPTCIYRLSGSKGEITLAVESAKLSQATRGMDRRHAVTVAGRTALCGRLGSPMLFVPLAGGRLLNVTAPCSIAQQFAGRALGRLEA